MAVDAPVVYHKLAESCESRGRGRLFHLLSVTVYKGIGA